MKCYVASETKHWLYVRDAQLKFSSNTKRFETCHQNTTSKTQLLIWTEMKFERFWRDTH